MNRFTSDQVYQSSWRITSASIGYGDNFTSALTLSQTSPGFHVSAVQVFGKHCGKRRNCS